MDDLISRQAVLDLLQEEREEVHITSEAITKISIAEINVEDLKALPSVSVAGKTGRWKKIKSGDKAFPKSLSVQDVDMKIVISMNGILTMSHYQRFLKHRSIVRIAAQRWGWVYDKRRDVEGI